MKMNKRRQFSDEYKSEAVRRVLQDGCKPAQVARELGIERSVMAGWLKRAREEMGQPEAGPLTETEREELERLRREADRLRMERDILKKAAALFARDGQ